MKNLCFLLTLIVTSLIPCKSLSQNLLRNPEHIVYDHLHQRYLVTNNGNGTIVAIDKTGNQQTVLTGLSQCMGIHIQDTILMISYGKKIRFLDLNTLRQFREVTLNTSTWLDGMITDNQRNVYVIESGGKIFKVSLDTFEATTIVSSGVPPYAQDLAFDPLNNRLIVVAWELNSSIKAVNLSDFTVSTLMTTQLGNFDGIIRDSLGNLYVSCHRNGGKVYRFDHSLQQAPVIIYSGLISPAGLGLNDPDNVIAIPDYDGNTVSFYNGIYSGIDQPNDNTRGDIRIIGNELYISSDEPCLSISAYSVDGRILCSLKVETSPYHIDLTGLKRHYGNQIIIFRIQTRKDSYSRKVFLAE